ncbi:hypothetical protein P3T76_002666 [Phytophthora citrophthora]|uniref:PX domain-containing protein n=1 Tax=Phytophthora citrophthora TaxID=4793 RepID=A0AAD9GX21_9STRA|nr:hypothetical protein P3T76_002666 [Phytophthora citrophthora]
MDVKDTTKTAHEGEDNKEDEWELPSPPRMKLTSNNTRQVTNAVLEVNRELVAQNIWLREQLTVDMKSKQIEKKKNETEEKLRLENRKLRQLISELERKLEKKKEIALLSAKVIESRIAFRDNQQFVEYKLQLETDIRGTMFVWYRYSTFRKLAETMQAKQGHFRKSVPELPSKQLFGNFSDKIIQERVIKLNQFLDAATNSDHLHWGIRVDADTCVYKRRKKSSLSSSLLKTREWSLPSKKSEVNQYGLVTTAKAVDSRIQGRADRPFVEYQLKMKTDTKNTLLVWYRYSSLYDWAELVQRENPSTKIPQLPIEEPFGSFSKRIPNETAKLNAFTKNLVKSDNLQWVVKVDQSNMFVSKLRVKEIVLSTTMSSSQETDTESSCSSPLSKLLPLKSIVQRQRKRSDAMLYERKMAQFN